MQDGKKQGDLEEVLYPVEVWSSGPIGEVMKELAVLCRHRLLA